MAKLECVKQDGMPLYAAPHSNYDDPCSLVTATGEAAEAYTGRIFPNPAERILQVELEIAEPVVVRLYALGSGRVIAEKKGVAGQLSIELDLDGWPAGMYVVEVAGATGRGWRRVVKGE